MIFIGLTMLGVVSYRNLVVELYPNAELPVLFVQIVSQLEVDPEYIENQAVIPLEGAIGTLEGIEEINSTASRQRGVIVVYYTQDTNIKYAYLKLQEKIDEIKSSLPSEFMVMVVKIDTEQLSNQFMSLQVRGSGGIDRVRNFTDKEILKELENVNGIANVEVFGGREKSVEILLNSKACKAHGITPSQIRTLLSQNGQARVFAGNINGNNMRIFVNVTAEYNDIHQISNLVVKADGPLLLKDIAQINFGVKEETSFSRVNGKDAVTVELIRDFQVNLIDLSHRTQETIERLNEKFQKSDIEIVVQSNSAETMEKNIDLIIELALVGGLLAIFVLWLFLRNIGLVSVISLAIPISVFTAFNFFYAYNISLNSLTLVGMALAVGMLLDNSVVVLENIYRLAGEGKKTDEAVIRGTTEVWRSILASTLTTITVFFPFIFSTNYMIRIIGNHIGVSIISTLMVSLVVAMLLIPMITHFFLSKGGKSNVLMFEKVSIRNRLIQVYLTVLKACMRYPARTIIGALTVFFATVLISLALSINSLNEVENVEFNVYVTMPAGSTLATTDAVVADIEKNLEKIKEAKDVVSKIYEDEAVITLKLHEDFKEIANRDLAEIKNDTRSRVEEIRSAEVSLEAPQTSESRFGDGGMGGRNPVVGFERLLGIGSNTEKIVVKGNDFEKMKNVAEDIEYYLRSLQNVATAQYNVASERPEVHLEFDTEIMERYGISLATVATELAGFGNDVTAGLSFKQGTYEYDIVIKSDETKSSEDKTIEELKALNVRGQTGSLHQLQEISKIVFSSGTSTIQRVNQEKQIEVTYTFLPEVVDSKDLLEAAQSEVESMTESLHLPSGIAIEVVHGEDELKDYYFLIGAAFVLIYMILASVFESFATPFVLMFSIPLAAVGSLIALILTNNSLLNANTLTGFLILIGVVVNNGIILIDYSLILRRQGYNRNRSLMMAGMARVRPILITAITTIIGMFPLAMGKAEYVTAIGAPFAITVIGGLALSTLFTLIFIPTLNSGLEFAIEWFKNLKAYLKIIQIALFSILFFLIYTEIDSFVWQMIDFFIALILIPGTTFFIMTSLRRAKAEVIGKTDKLHIRVQNLVKTYDRDSRFVRELKSGNAIRQHDESIVALGDQKFSAQRLVWQVPLLAFLIYFTYSYIESGFWVFITTHFVYFYALYFWASFKSLFSSLKLSFVHRLIDRMVFYGLPLLNLLLFYFWWDNISLTIFITVLWYLSIAVYVTSNMLHSEKININRLSGRFRGIRRTFYEFVKIIPIIGKRREPFKALRGVSFDIQEGMFGLLGPNGAGKTTLMRIICGILEQSYGKIWINGIDTLQKREELQGLIGYLPQEFGMYENMTAYEFLSYMALLKGLSHKENREKMVDYVLKAVHMETSKNEKIGSFSGGMKQRIGIAQILLHLPRILVVDEPTAGLDPRERIRFRNLLVELSRERIVIFSTHIIEDIASSCNRVAVINKGSLKYIGEPAKMAGIADGFVWQFDIPSGEFASIQKDLLILHHMRDGDNIRIRCLSEKMPYEGATQVKPLLEDAYLWLLKK